MLSKRGHSVQSSARRLFCTLAVVLLMTVFSSGCSGSASADHKIDGLRALDHVKEIIAFGPHPSGSEAQKKVAGYIESVLTSYGLELETQEFAPVTPIGKVSMKNILGKKKGASDRVLILASHYDSKLFRDQTFVGANDGGSSSGLLLELARVLAQHNPTGLTLWFVFFDGEEAFETWTSLDSLYGSREMVRRVSRSGELQRIAAMILLDMVGGKDLNLRKDDHSTSWLNEIIWQQARKMGHSDIFRPTGRTAAIDDHVPFAEAGIPVVDLIDLNYTHWHQPGDTLDKLSAENLEIVGNVVLTSLPEIEKKLVVGGW